MSTSTGPPSGYVLLALQGGFPPPQLEGILLVGCESSGVRLKSPGARLHFRPHRELQPSPVRIYVSPGPACPGFLLKAHIRADPLVLVGVPAHLNAAGKPANWIGGGFKTFTNLAREGVDSLTCLAP